MKRPLYLANNLQDLKKQVEKSSYGRKLDMLLRVSDKLYKETLRVKQTEPLDEELLYVLCTRYTNLVDAIKSQIKDDRFIQSRFSTPLSIIDSIKSDTATSLLSRYMDNVTSITRAAIKKNEDSQVEANQPNLVTLLGIKDTDLFIVPESLYALLNDKNTTVLIIDARSPNHFKEVQIKVENMINIGDNIIRSGLSTNTLTKLLTGKTQEKFINRYMFDLIVLVDINTNEQSYSYSKLRDLRQIMVEWDLNEFQKTFPLILNGGLLLMGETYPTLFTDPGKLISQSMSLYEDFLKEEDIIYPDFLTDLSPDDGTINNSTIVNDIISSLDPSLNELTPIPNAIDNDDVHILKPSNEKESVSPMDWSWSNDQSRKNYETPEDSNLPISQSDISEPENETSEQIILNLKDITNSVIETTKAIIKILSKRICIMNVIISKKSLDHLTELEKTNREITNHESKRKTLMAERIRLSELVQNMKLSSNDMTEIAALCKQATELEKEKAELEESEEELQKSILVMQKNKANKLNDRIIPEIPDRSTKPISDTNYTNQLLDKIRSQIKTNGLVGLVNEKNTCYMNSLIQCLRFCPPFLHNTMFRSTTKMLSKQLQTLILRTWISTRTLETKAFYQEVCRADNNVHGYKNGQHEDVQEFMLFMIEKLHDENRVSSTNFHSEIPRVRHWARTFEYKNSFYNRAFFHQVEVTSSCSKCNKCFTKYSYDTTLYIPLADGTETTDIQQKINEYLKPAAPDTSSDVTAFCSTCERPYVFRKKISYYPLILVVNIVRYKFSRSESTIIRINRDCVFQDEIKFGNCKYILNSISLHTGNKDKGHYTALCFNPFDNKWYEFNDEYVTAVNPNNPGYRSKCYLLFYSISQNPEKLNAGFYKGASY